MGFTQHKGEPPLIDTHAHLDMEAYAADREVVLRRARAAGVVAILTIGTDEASSRQAVALAERDTDRGEAFPRLYATVGVHPHEAKEARASTWEALLKLSRHPRVVAWGEVGLDYHYDHSPREAQRAVFREQIRLARARELPLVVHQREAEEETLRILKDEGAEAAGGVFHCYTADAEYARAVLDLGFFISFAGVVTFRNSEGLREVARLAPLDRILVETDAPYLAPVPHRGKRNEPAYVRLVAERVAGARGMALEELARATTENARRLFKI
ncbi:MAG: TatD family hydrolase [Nitrospirae bacterium]|nr:TatD family hydrolase [Nitrospirota bacterium]